MEFGHEFAPQTAFPHEFGLPSEDLHQQQLFQDFEQQHLASLQDPNSAMFAMNGATPGQRGSCGDVKPRLTKEQHDILEAHYQKQQKPNTSTKRSFAESLNVSLEKVNVCVSTPTLHCVVERMSILIHIVAELVPEQTSKIKTGCQEAARHSWCLRSLPDRRAWSQYIRFRNLSCIRFSRVRANDAALRRRRRASRRSVRASSPAAIWPASRCATHVQQSIDKLQPDAGHGP